MLKKGNIETASIEKIKASVLPMFATRKGVELICTKESRMFFMVLGGSYSMSKPIEYEHQLPNVLGGKPFPSHVTIALKKVDRESGRAIIICKQTLDSDKTQKILEKTLKDMAEKLGNQAPNGEMFKSLAIDDTAECVVDLPSGWLDHLVYKRVIKMGERTQEDITVLRKKEQEK